MDEKTRWGTLDEIRFVEGAGMWSERRESTLERRRRMLEGYLKAARKRQEWGEIDKERVIRRVEELLGREGERW